MVLDHQALWHALPLVVIDFETTGKDPVTCEPVEVAAVRFEQGAVTESYTTLLRTLAPIPAEATAIHGITDEMVANAPSLPDVAGELAIICRSAVPVAYNAPYDRRVLHRHITGSDCPAFDPHQTWMDVLMVVASKRVDRWVKGPGRLRLGNTCQRHGIAHDSAHRAKGDALATGRLLWQLFDRGKIQSCTLDRMVKGMARARVLHDADHARFRERLARETGS